jgi:membrane-bound ClpP family serine protease
MEWIAIIGLIVIGLFLVIVEILFIPGTTIFGILGGILMLSGIFYSYLALGISTATWVFFFTVVGTIFTIILSLRTKSWERFSLKTVLEGKSFEDISMKLQVGERGKTVSTLRPSGNVEFPQGIYEATSYGPMIGPNTDVQIEKIVGNKIFVQPL